MFNESVKMGLKLILRFAVLWTVATVFKKFLVMFVECSIHAWDVYPAECLNIVFCVGLALADLFDGAIFGRSVIDTFFDKLKSVASVKDETPPTSGGK